MSDKNNLNKIQKSIFNEKYALKKVLPDGSTIHKETDIDQLWERVSLDTPDYYEMFKNMRVIPQGSILFGLKNPYVNTSLDNCYVLDLDGDSLEDIFNLCSRMARIFSYRGGVGIDISKLRPKGARVNNAALTSTGSVSFMELFSTVTSIIGQNGRRGALMITIDISHPDVEDFIEVKANLDKVTSANISVKVTDAFMEAVKNDADWDLKFDGVVYKTVKAKDLFKKIADRATNFGEPGILFWDTIKTHTIADHYHLSDPESYSHLQSVSTNPCGEVPLPNADACRLIAINLTKYVDNLFKTDKFTMSTDFKWDLLEKDIFKAVEYIDSLIDINKAPLPEGAVISKKTRRVGLTITGLADLLIHAKVRYGSEESRVIVRSLMNTIANNAYMSSSILAKSKGSFPDFNYEIHSNSPFYQRVLTSEVKDHIKKHGIRNIHLLSCSPTGTISAFTNTSSGIEPIFDTVYMRRVTLNGSTSYFVIPHPMFGIEVEEYVDAESARQRLQAIRKEIDKVKPSYFVTAHDIDWKDRIEMQSAIQFNVDQSISSTVNLPKGTTSDLVMDLYLMAWEKKCKGITVYVDGCREGVLSTGKESYPQMKPPLKHREPNSMLPCVCKKLVAEGGKQIYITLGKDSETGDIYEILVKSNDQFDREDLVDAMTRLMSLCFRYHVPTEEISKQLTRVKHKNINSLPYRIGLELNSCVEYLKNMEVNLNKSELELNLDCAVCN